MNNIDINAEPVSTIKISSTNWNPGKGRQQQLEEKAVEADAFKKARLDGGKDLELRLLVMEHALADLQKKVQKIVSTTED